MCEIHARLLHRYSTRIDRTNGQRSIVPVSIRRERERETAQTGLLVDDHHQASGFMLHNRTAGETEESGTRDMHIWVPTHNDKSDKVTGACWPKEPPMCAYLHWCD